MTRNLTRIVGILAFTTLAACVDDMEMEEPGPMTPSETDLTYLEGARAGQAEMDITNQGYQLVRSDGLTNYWFNFDTGACARITTTDGRYAAVDMLPSGDC